MNRYPRLLRLFYLLPILTLLAWTPAPAAAPAPVALSSKAYLPVRPVLDNSGNPTLPSINEDEPPAGNNGILLADLIGTSITDADAGAVEGIAVTGLSGNGTWQYSLDGVTWLSFGAVSESQATTLRALIPLYDGLAGGAPASQGWLARNTMLSTETTGANATTLDSMANFIILDGYSSHTDETNPVNSAYPILNAATGYTIRFEVKLNSESHNTADRAGFAIVSVSNTITKAIELDFWSNEIWAQEDGILNNPPYALFTHGLNSVAYDAAHNTLYDLTIQGSAYTLFANGVSILTGPLRDYTAWDHLPVLPFDPYETANFLFLGDNSTSARSSFTLARAEILEKTRIRFKPAPHFSGTPAITFKAWDTTNGSGNGATNVDTTAGSAFSTAGESASLTVKAIADAPTLEVQQAAGNEDSAIPLNITAALVDADGSETLSIQITGVPLGATLSAGLNQGGGVWSLTQAQLAGLTLRPPPNDATDFSLMVRATATEASNQDSASTGPLLLNVTVQPINDAPTISNIADQITRINTPLGPIPFTIGDAETPANALNLSVYSSNSSLLSETNIGLGGSGPNRTLTLTPTLDQTGTTTIAITVSDTLLNTVEQFNLIVARFTNFYLPAILK